MEQKKWKFNIIDLLAIAVVVIGVAFVCWRMTDRRDAEPTGGETYYVSFFAESVPDVVAQELTVGDAGVNASRNLDIGTLVEFTVGDAVVYSPDAQGQLQKCTKEGYCSISLTFRLTGVQEPTGLLVGDYHLNTGYYISIFVGNTYLNTYVTTIVPAGEQ